MKFKREEKKTRRKKPYTTPNHLKEKKSPREKSTPVKRKEPYYSKKQSINCYFYYSCGNTTPLNNCFGGACYKCASEFYFNINYEDHKILNRLNDLEMDRYLEKIDKDISYVSRGGKRLVTTKGGGTVNSLDLTKIRRFLEKIISLKGNKFKVRALVLDGEIYRIKKDHVNALNRFNEALKVDPCSIKALNEKSHIYSFLGEYEKEIKVYTRIIELKPKDVVNYYMWSGNLNYRLNNIPRAIRDYNTGGNIYPPLKRGANYCVNKSIEGLKCKIFLKDVTKY